jgi:hypothetical protein
MTITNRKHDLVAIQVYDRRIEDLPSVGLINVKDAETGNEQWIDTSSLSLRKAHSEWWKTKQDKLRNAFNKSRVDAVSVRTDQDFVKALLTLFEKRN